MMGVSSFAYWLLWIGAGIYTATFSTGVAGLPMGVAFGVPIGFGLLYPVIKCYRYLNNHVFKQKPAENAATDEEQMMVENDAANLMQKIVARRHYDLSKEKLAALLPEGQREVGHFEGCSTKLQARLCSLTQDVEKKAAMNFVSDTMSTYVTVQYACWILTDFLTKVNACVTNIPIVNVVMGWTLIGVSVLHGIYKAATGYYARQNTKTQALEVLGQNHAGNLEVLYKVKLARINALQRELPAGEKNLPVKFLEVDHPQFYGDKNRSAHTWKSDLKKILVRAMTFTNGITTGAFVTRIFTVDGTAIFLPFLTAGLSNPLTMGLVIGIGVLYGAFKAYEYHLNRKETRAKEALEKRSEHIEHLTHQVELADLAVRALENRKANLKVKEATGDIVDADVKKQLQRKVIPEKVPAKHLAANDKRPVVAPPPVKRAAGNEGRRAMRA